MRYFWEIVLAILAALATIFFGWWIFNNSAVTVAKGGSEALYGIKTIGINEFATFVASIVN